MTYSQISPVMRQAIVAIEDNRFWQEGALDLKGTMRALVNNLQHKAVPGWFQYHPSSTSRTC